MIESDKLYLRVAYDVECKDGARKKVDAAAVVCALNEKISLLLRRSGQYVEHDTGGIYRVDVGVLSRKFRRVMSSVNAVNDVYDGVLETEEAVLTLIAYSRFLDDSVDDCSSDEYGFGVGKFDVQIKKTAEFNKGVWSASHNGKPKKLRWFSGFDV